MWGVLRVSGMGVRGLVTRNQETAKVVTRNRENDRFRENLQVAWPPKAGGSAFRSIQNLLENPFDLNSSHLVKGYCLGVFKPLLFPGWFGRCVALRPAGGGPSPSPRSRPP